MITWNAKTNYLNENYSKLKLITESISLLNTIELFYWVVNLNAKDRPIYTQGGCYSSLSRKYFFFVLTLYLYL